MTLETFLSNCYYLLTGNNDVGETIEDIKNQGMFDLDGQDNKTEKKLNDFYNKLDKLKYAYNQMLTELHTLTAHAEKLDR